MTTNRFNTVAKPEPASEPWAGQRVERRAQAPDAVQLRRAAARARERLAILGLVFLSAGAALVYMPAGLIVPGVYLLVRSWPPRRSGGGDVAR